MPVDTSIYQINTTPDLVGSYMRGQSFGDMIRKKDREEQQYQQQQQRQEDIKGAFFESTRPTPGGAPVIDRNMLLSKMAQIDPERYMQMQDMYSRQTMAERAQTRGEESLDIARDTLGLRREQARGTQKIKEGELKLKQQKVAKGKELSSTQIRPFQDAQTAYGDVMTLWKTAQENKDLFGPISGLRAKNPFDEQARNVQSEIDRVRQVVGKALEGGVLRKEDEEKYKKILPVMGDRPMVVKHKLEQLAKKMKADMNTYLKGNKAAGYNIENLTGLVPKDKEKGFWSYKGETSKGSGDQPKPGWAE